MFSEPERWHGGVTTATRALYAASDVESTKRVSAAALPTAPDAATGKSPLGVRAVGWRCVGCACLHQKVFNGTSTVGWRCGG